MSAETKTDPPASKVPDWIKAEAFVDVLKESVPAFSKIKSFKASSGTAPGENYGTVMLRLNIDVELQDGSEKSVSYILKVPHQMPIFDQMLKKHNIFEVERMMYSIHVPEMEQLYRDAGVEVKFGAKAYKLKDAKSEYVLLEDLSPRGFKICNRLEGLDQVHTETALQRLAMWHAASAMRVATKGPYPELVTLGLFNENSRSVISHLDMSDIFLDSCSTYEGHEAYIDQVRVVQPKLNDEIYKKHIPDPNEFNVLNHGDFWSNNIMYSHDSFGKIKDICLIDFQLPKFGSVAQDLYYILLSSTKFEDKLTKFDYYVKFYHEILTDNLKLLKYPKALPTLRDLHISLIKHGSLGFLTAKGVMSSVLMEPSENATMENFVSDSAEGDEFKNLLYTSSRYRKHIQVVMPWLYNRGALEL